MSNTICEACGAAYTRPYGMPRPHYCPACVSVLAAGIPLGALQRPEPRAERAFITCGDCRRPIRADEGRLLPVAAPYIVCRECYDAHQRRRPNYARGTVVPGVSRSIDVSEWRSAAYTLSDADARVVTALHRWAGFDGDSGSQGYAFPLSEEAREALAVRLGALSDAVADERGRSL